MPTEPSVTIQVSSPRGSLWAIGPATGAAFFPCGWEDPGRNLPKFPERFAFNFFSILLAGGLNIAQKGRQGPLSAF
jgi:hypothetical protein